MISIPNSDPVGALMPHTLQAPVQGAPQGPLAGLSFMVKDLFAIAGHKVSNGNPDWYAHAHPAGMTAHAIYRLVEAGATLTGITVCDEFFYSVLGSNVHYGTPVNPRAPDHVTGGSSCGSAAAVAASMCDFALGSDTGGSIRVPASFCGLYGLRPTHGRIDMAGATPMAPTYDTVGFLARGAGLFRTLGQVLLQGERVEAPIKRLIIAEDMFARAETSIDAALWQLLAKVGRALPQPERKIIAGDDIDQWRDAFRLVQGSEIQSTLLPFIQSHSPKLGPGIWERFQAAAAITPAEAEKARAARVEIAEGLDNLLRPGTVVMLPTTPTLPPKRGIPDGSSTSEFRALTLASTCLAGHAGLPQISIPGAEAAKCPTGLSFIGWKGADEALLDLAVRLEPILRKTS
ncbi:MAG: amidase [Methyloceanibacter sp.]